MAVRFDASGDRLRHTANLPSSTSFTMAGWAYYVAARGAFAYLASLGSNTSNSLQWVDLGWTSGNVFQLSCGGSGASTANFSSGPSAGTAFFWAVSVSAAGAGNALGYWRAAGNNGWNSTVSAGAASFTPAVLDFGSNSWNEWANVRLWNIKQWDRALSSEELLIESFYARPMFPASLSRWLKLPNANDTGDYSGNGRSPTVQGTLTTEDGPVNLWVPKRKIFLPAAASGTTYTITPSGGITFAGTPTITRRNQIPVSGGVVFSGTNVFLRERVVPVSGGVSFAGTAPITFVNGSVTYTITPSGGITFAGTVEQDHTRTYAVSGGIAFSGTVSTQITKQINPTGGITLSGDVSFIRENVWDVSGGVSFGGSAPITFNGNVPTSVTTRLPLTSMGQ